MSQIIRIQGEAPPLIWTPAIDAAIQVIKDHRIHCSEAYKHPNPNVHRDWWWTFMRLRKAVCAAFGEAQGWTVDRSWSRRIPKRWKLDLLEFHRWQWGGNEPPNDDYQLLWNPGDHSEWFQIGRRRAAFTSHEYGSLTYHGPVPHGLVVDQLPTSWYNEHTTGFCFRPAIDHGTAPPRIVRPRYPVKQAVREIAMSV